MKIALLLALIALSPPLQAAPTCAAPAPGSPLTATITFTAPTKNTDGTALTLPVTYNVYQGTATGAEVKAGSGLAGSPINLTTGLSAGITYYWYLTVVDANGEGPPSNEVCKSFGASVPGSVVITIS